MNPEESLTLTPVSYENVLKEMFGYKPETYVKKPVPITAYCIDRHDFEVDTPEGWVEGKKGDYLIINSDGSMYPAARNVFKELYTLYKFEEESEPI